MPFRANGEPERKMVGQDCVPWLVPPGATIPIFGAAAGVALLGLAWFATFHIGPIEHADVSIFRGFGEVGSGARASLFGHPIASLCNEKPYSCLCAVPVLVAVARRRLWLVFEVGLILVGANLTTYVLKQLLAHPRAASLLGGPHPLPPTSWPSGHTTAATSLALCCVLVAPSRLRPFVAAGGAAFVVAIAYSLLVTNTHYPSDVVAGFIVAGIWTLLGAGIARLAIGAKSSVHGPGPRFM
jgi:membrane-associated phospholipid phosphatase